MGGRPRTGSEAAADSAADLTVACERDRYGAVTATGSVVVVGRDVPLRATLTTSQ